MKSLPKGFRGAAIAAGLKSTGALDLTIIENLGPRFDAAAVYTSNKVVAAPVIWSREVTKGKLVRAAVLNSGGANACTGPQGFADTHEIAADQSISISPLTREQGILVCRPGHQWPAPEW